VHTSGQWLILFRFSGAVPLGRARLSQRFTSPPLADAELLLNMAHGIAATRRA